MTFQDDELLRSEIANPRCEDSDYCETIGQKEKMIFKELLYFHAFECLSVDPAHDMLEGIFQGESKAFMKEIIECQKLIKLDVLNERIKCFNYGIIDCKKKPSPVNLKKLGNLVEKRAAQTRCLSLYLPLILSDIVTAAKRKS